MTNLKALHLDEAHLENDLLDSELQFPFDLGDAVGRLQKHLLHVRHALDLGLGPNGKKLGLSHSITFYHYKELHSTDVALMLLTQRPWVRILDLPRFFPTAKFVDSRDKNRTHQVLKQRILLLQ